MGPRVYMLSVEYAFVYMICLVTFSKTVLKPFGSGPQRCKLCRKMGRSFPVSLGTSSRILRGSPVVFVLSSNFAVTYALFGYFWVNLPDFQHFWVNFGHFWANFEHFLTAFISRFLVNGSDSQ